MNISDKILENNRKWANKVTENNPDFFKELAKGQAPEVLWIGCSDSRVPANVITDLPPGELFVHRNIANLIIDSDINFLSVLQYAVEVLKIKHIIICGHYGCGGIEAALTDQNFGRIDDWLAHIKEIVRANLTKLKGLEAQEKSNLLCELNVKVQVANICKTDIVRRAWENGEELSVHGIIYNLKNGILNKLSIPVSSLREAEEIAI